MKEQEFKGLMSPETEKKLGAKLKFKNKIAELVDGPLVTIIDNRIFCPLAQKLPADIRKVLVEALEKVIDEMDEIEV